MSKNISDMPISEVATVFNEKYAEAKPYINEINIRVRNFIKTVTDFSRENKWYPASGNPWGWVWNFPSHLYVTADDISLEEKIVCLEYRDGYNTEEQIVSFDEIDNIETLLETKYAAYLAEIAAEEESNKRKTRDELLKKKAQLEDELKALNAEIN